MIWMILFVIIPILIVTILCLNSRKWRVRTKFYFNKTWYFIYNYFLKAICFGIVWIFASVWSLIVRGFNKHGFKFIVFITALFFLWLFIQPSLSGITGKVDWLKGIWEAIRNGAEREIVQKEVNRLKAWTNAVVTVSVLLTLIWNFTSSEKFRKFTKWLTIKFWKNQKVSEE